MSTPPLLLRPWRPDDAPELRAAIDESLDALRPWITWASREPTPLPVLEARLAQYAADFRAGSRWRYAVVERDTGLLLGGASLHPYPGPGALEVGYWVRSSQLRRGVASTAAAALARHAFLARGVERVEIWCDPGNRPSMAVAEALGFTHAGPRMFARDDGSPRPMEVYRLDAPAGLRFPPGVDVRIRDEPVPAVDSPPAPG
ncbi:MAG: GNAT family N-acetyltransferase [Gemmatimonadetes bacterium]|nr:GNAT family N-acetyltransferase [Gemmatimonadota bacterium]